MRNTDGFPSVRTMVLVLAAGLSVGWGPAIPHGVSKVQDPIELAAMPPCVDENGNETECPPPPMPPCVDENGNEKECPAGLVQVPA